MGGGFGNGKTAAICIKTLKVARAYPGANILMARATYGELNDTLRKEFFKWCPQQWIKRKPTVDDNTLVLKNGTTINFRYLQQKGKSSVDGSTTSNVLSATYDLIVVDQIEDPRISHKDYMDLFGRLRGSTPYRGDDPDMPKSGPRWMLLTCNPTRNWVFTEVVKPMHDYMRTGQHNEKLMMDPETGELMLDLIEGSTYTNKSNLPPDFIKGLEAQYSGQMRERFLMGKWAAFEGLVFPQFNHEVHVVRHSEMMEYLEKEKVAGFAPRPLEFYDFGIISPSSYNLAFVDRWGIVHHVDGFYAANLNPDAQAERIKELREKYRKVGTQYRQIIADNNMFKRLGMGAGVVTTGDNLASVFSSLGISMTPGMKDKLGNIAKISMYLVGRDDVPAIYNRVIEVSPKDGETINHVPYYYASTNCHWVVDEFSNYFWSRSSLGDMQDKPIDRHDHFLDAFGYGLSFRPKPSEVDLRMAQLPALYMWREVDEVA